MAALFPGLARLRAQTSASIGPMPATLEIGVGQTGAVTVVLDGAQQAYGIDVRGTFDPNVIEIVAAQPDSPLTAGGFIQDQARGANKADNIAGTFQWAYSQLSPSEAVNGSGPVFVIQVRGKAAGRFTAITLTAVDLSDRDGMPLPVARRAGTISVLGAPGEATATAAPPTAPPTAVQGATLAPPAPTQTSKVPPDDASAPTPRPLATTTAVVAPSGQAPPTRAVVNVTAQPAATPVAPVLAASPLPPATPFATPAQVPAAGTRAPAAPAAPATPGAPAMPGAPTTPGAASVAPSPAPARATAGASLNPTLAPDALAAAAQSGLAPKAPVLQPQGGAVAPATANPPAAATGPDPLTGIVLLAIGLAGAYGFGAVDRQRQRGSK